jgi:type IV pilus assembly protein PilW
MMRPADAPVRSSASGLTLIELLVALSLASLLILGLVQIVAAASAAGSLQLNQAQIQDHARYATNLLSRAVRQAGYRPEPWNDAFTAEAFTAESADNVTPAGDRLAVRNWSDLNCFDNRNPDRDSDGNPRFYVRESVFDVNHEGSLTYLCRYGPTTADLIVQIRRQGLVPGVESFQVLYGEDADGDGNIERWIPAGAWVDPVHVLGVQIGLLLAGEDVVAEPVARRISVLDAVMAAPPDGRLRRVFEFAVAMRGRTG